MDCQGLFAPGCLLPTVVLRRLGLAHSLLVCNGVKAISEGDLKVSPPITG